MIFVSNHLVSDINNLASSAKFVDGNYNNPALVRNVQEFINKYNGENIALKIVYGVLKSNLSSGKISWLAKCLPVFVSLKAISEIESHDIYQCLESILTNYML